MNSNQNFIKRKYIIHRQDFLSDETYQYSYDENERAWNIERNIALIIMNHPHENIVKIYNVGDDFIEMEYLQRDFNRTFENKDFKFFTEAMKHFHKHGICYIDWKIDNMGYDNNNVPKIFDFNASGIFDINNQNIWIIEPVKWFSYSKALHNNIIGAINIDFFCLKNSIEDMVKMLTFFALQKMETS